MSDTGTLREVLTSALSKVGRSFYIDPFTQKIRILNNSDVASINNNLNAKYLNFSNTEAAEQLNLSKSIREVNANHFFVSADLDVFEKEVGGFSGFPEVLRKHVLFRLEPNDIKKSIAPPADLVLLASVAMFAAELGGKSASDEDLDLYTMSLQASDPKRKNGKLYGQNEINDTKDQTTTREEGSWATD